MMEIKVPTLGESVSEATVAKWFKKEGDSVQKDDVLVELETDKVTLEVSAQSSGVLVKVDQKEGSTVKVNQVLGSIKEGAVASAAKVESKKEEQKQVSPVAVPDAKASSPTEGAGPAARKIMTENNIAPSSVAGTGKDGRITKGDVLSALATGIGGVSQPSSGPREERVKMSKLRQVIAKRLKDSQNTAAMLTTFNEIDMSAILQLRKEYGEGFEKRHGVKLGFMGFFTKAAVKALKELPAVNAEIDGDEIVYKNHYDISIAVGTEQGLVVPVVRDSDTRSLAGIEKEILNLAKKARDGKLTASDMSGGTFTITNGGIYGSLLSTPIINPPQSAILGLHKIQERPIVIAGEMKIRPMMYVALSYDHRIIDGREAVTFLVKIKEAMEDPRRILLDI